MAILAYGLNFRTASLQLRESIAFSPDRVRDLLPQLIEEVPAVLEAAVISTCNRTEFYCATSGGESPDLESWLSEQCPVDRATLASSTYTYRDFEAVAHMMRVSSGLDSQILGEPQILGQVRDACEVARAVGTLGPELSLATDAALRAAKEVRTKTEIGKHPVSVAYAAVSLARQLFRDIGDKSLLLIGAGDTCELVARHMQSQQVDQITIANRTLSHAEELATQFDGRAIGLDDIEEKLHQFDMVISSTGAPKTIVSKLMVESALRQRKRKPILIIDIAVPRDVEPETAQLEDAYLYTVDDLGEIIDNNVSQRESAAKEAELIVQSASERFLGASRALHYRQYPRKLARAVDEIRDREIERALRALATGNSPEEVITQLGSRIAAKLAHPPMSHLRKASEEDDLATLTTIANIFDLTSDQPSED